MEVIFWAAVIKKIIKRKKISRLVSVGCFPGILVTFIKAIAESRLNNFYLVLSVTAKYFSVTLLAI